MDQETKITTELSFIQTASELKLRVIDIISIIRLGFNKYRFRYLFRLFYLNLYIQNLYLESFMLAIIVCVSRSKIFAHKVDCSESSTKLGILETKIVPVQLLEMISSCIQLQTDSGSGKISADWPV